MMTLRCSVLTGFALLLAVLCSTPESSHAMTLPDPKGVVYSKKRRHSSSTAGVVPSFLVSNGKIIPLAMAIPGNGIVEQVFVGGFANFLQVYNLVITGRVLLSWFPQAQGVAALQPVFAITDPYLNLFRGLLPPVFGLDLSPLLAFFLLNAASSATVALGCDKDCYDQRKVHPLLVNNSRFLGRRGAAPSRN